MRDWITFKCAKLVSSCSNLVARAVFDDIMNTQKYDGALE